MSDNYEARDNFALEGDDFECFVPLKVIVWGDQFASVEDAEVCFSASGHNALAEVARRLLKAGQDGDRQLVVIYRAAGGERIGRISISEAAQGNKYE